MEVAPNNTKTHPRSMYPSFNLDLLAGEFRMIRSASSRGCGAPGEAVGGWIVLVVLLLDATVGGHGSDEPEEP